MAQKKIQGNAALASQIKSRRNELGLTIEEAASRAGVGTKTWCRYEAGESIRMDKCKGICKALNWRALPGQEEETDDGISVQEYRNHEAWSPFLENVFGTRAAMSFAAGSDILLDQIQEDLSELAAMPVGSHIGQISTSWLCGSLPEQFLMHYDYDFVYQMKCVLQSMRWRAKYGQSMMAHSVMEELLFYLCSEEASVLFELSSGINGLENDDFFSEDWVFDLFGDEDIVSFLYTDYYLNADHPYHFLHWMDQQFYMEESESAEGDHV